MQELKPTFQNQNLINKKVNTVYSNTGKKLRLSLVSRTITFNFMKKKKKKHFFVRKYIALTWC